MDLKLLCGLLSGIALMLCVLICVMKWRGGRAARKGRRGERMVSKELSRLKKRDAIVLNDVFLSTGGGKSSQIDHVVVSVRGIFVIETKSLAGRITGSEHSQYWTQHLARQSRQFYNPLLQNRAHIRALRRVITDIDESFFTSMIVFTEAWRIEVKADEIVEERRFLPARHIRRTFIPSERRKKRWWRPGKEVRLDEANIVTGLEDMREEIIRRPCVIDRDDLQSVADAISAASARSRGEMGSHINYARETSRNVSREIRQGICPRCGGQLVVKRGEKGEFVGCVNYPECRFTCSIDCLH